MTVMRKFGVTAFDVTIIMLQIVSVMYSGITYLSLVYWSYVVYYNILLLKDRVAAQVVRLSLETPYTFIVGKI